MILIGNRVTRRMRALGNRHRTRCARRCDLRKVRRGPAGRAAVQPRYVREATLSDMKSTRERPTASRQQQALRGREAPPHRSCTPHNRAHARNGSRPMAAVRLDWKEPPERRAPRNRNHRAAWPASPRHRLRSARRDASRSRAAPRGCGDSVSLRGILAGGSRDLPRTAQSTHWRGCRLWIAARHNGIRVDRPKATRFNWSGHLTRAPPQFEAQRAVRGSIILRRKSCET